MKESGVFYVPQNPMGKGRGNKIRNLHIASASINTSWMKAGLTHPTKSNKILNKSAQSCQEWLTFICFCRNFKDLKQMTGQFDVCVVEDKLGCHFTFVSTMQTLSKMLSGLIGSPCGSSNSYWSLESEEAQAGLRARATWEQHVLFKYLTRTARSYWPIQSYPPKWLFSLGVNIHQNQVSDKGKHKQRNPVLLWDSCEWRKVHREDKK